MTQVATGCDGTAYQIKNDSLYVDGMRFPIGYEEPAELRAHAAYYDNVQYAKCHGWHPPGSFYEWNMDINNLTWTTYP